MSNFVCNVQILVTLLKFLSSVAPEFLYFYEEYWQPHTNSILEVQLATSRFLLPNFNYCQLLSTWHNSSNQSRNSLSSLPSSHLVFSIFFERWYQQYYNCPKSTHSQQLIVSTLWILCILYHCFDRDFFTFLSIHGDFASTILVLIDLLWVILPRIDSRNNGRSQR